MSRRVQRSTRTFRAAIAAAVGGLALGLILVTATAAAAQSDELGPEITIATSCLAGNGRVDINLVNTGDLPVTYRIEFGQLAPRQASVTPQDWWRQPITGRPDGAHALTILRDGTPISTTPVTIDCDSDVPQTPSPEVQIVNACRGGNGYILFQFVNESDTKKPYIIEFGALNNRSTTAAPHGASIRAVTGRPDGIHPYTITTTSGALVETGTITVTCDDFEPETTTYWVDPAGDNAADGSSANPWQTIQHAVNQSGPATTINVRGGVYSESVTIGTSGGAGFPLIIQSAPGETAILDGTAASGVVGFRMNTKHHVTIRGFEIRNYTATGVWELAAGVMVDGASTYVTIADNDIHDIVTTHPTSPIANGIGIYGTGASPLTNVVVTGNEVHDLVLGWSESVVLNGNVDGFEVTDNHIHHNDNIGIDIIGYESWLENGGVPPELNRARNGVIRGNYIHHIDSGLNPIYQGGRSAGGIYVDGGTSVVIHENVVHDANIGIELAAEHPGGFVDDITVFDNEFWGNHMAGIALGGYQPQRGTTTNVEVYNNTFYGNAVDPAVAQGEIWFQNNVTGNTIRDNIVHSGPRQLLLKDDGANLANNTLSGNLYDTDGVVGVFRSSGADEAQTLTSLSLIDPATGDLRLAPGLPAATSTDALVGVRTPDLQGRSRVVGAAG